MVQTAKYRHFEDPAGRRLKLRPNGNPLIDTLVWSGYVVEVNELLGNSVEMSLVKDQYVIQTLAT